MIYSDAPMQIVGLGASTAVGRDIWSTAAAVRAGLSGFRRHGFMVDDVARPLTVAAMPDAVDECPIVERMATALVSVIDEAVAAAEPRQGPLTCRLIVNLPAARPGLPADLASRIRHSIERAFDGRFLQPLVMTGGHAGGLLALMTARDWLAAHTEDCVVVAGVDSYLGPDVLEWLERTGQLHGAGRRNNAWGFVPGEGAGAVALMRADSAGAKRQASLGRVVSVGVGNEMRLIGTGEVCLGEGLTQAVRSALAGVASAEIFSDIYCDMNGEPYRADEYAFLITRTRERFASASDFQAPADCWGDVGAASGPLLMGLACVAGTKRYARGRRALIWASSVAGERAAVVVEPAAAVAA